MEQVSAENEWQIKQQCTGKRVLLVELVET
jgi:hypothetical protein